MNENEDEKWTVYSRLSWEDWVAFHEVMGGSVGVSYDPFAVAKQYLEAPADDEGYQEETINFAFFCSCTTGTLDPINYPQMVFISRHEKEKAVLVSIEKAPVFPKKKA
jgi:hypothetical protein